MSLEIELRKAAALINKGRRESARSILSAYLQDFPESDLAWLLMSYALDDPRLQQASAIRALRLNPENEQAKDRINQLSQIRSPTDSGVKIDLVDEVSTQYSPDDDFFHDQEGQTSIPFPAIEMPGAVTSHAASSDRHSVGDFPIEAFLALDDLLETPLERGLWPQRLPYCKNRHEHGKPGEQHNRVVEPHPRRQPIGNPKILKASTPHISNRAILIMMKTPVPSIAKPRPSRSRPRMSV